MGGVEYVAAQLARSRGGVVITDNKVSREFAQALSKHGIKLVKA